MNNFSHNKQSYVLNRCSEEIKCQKEELTIKEKKTFFLLIGKDLLPVSKAENC